LNKRIGELSAQIATLTKMLDDETARLSSQAEGRPTIEETIASINSRIEELKKEYAEKDNFFSKYLTSVKPNDKDLYLTARKASLNYPKVPYYVPGTDETGEFWVEPKVTDAGELVFNIFGCSIPKQ